MSKKFKMEYRPINEIKPYKNNPRKNDDAVQYVEASLREFDFTDPVIVDGKGELIAGHTRLKAAKKLGLKELPVIVRDDLTEDQIKALRIAHNKTGEFAEWDDELLSIELPEIEMDMEQFGFNMDDYLEEEQTDIIEDELPTEEEVETRTKRGDVGKLGRHRLMCGDSTKIEDVQVLMEDKKIDLVLTDPPYGVNVVGGDKPFGKVGGDNIVESKLYMPIKGDDSIESARSNYEIIKECSENQIIFGGNYFTEFLPPRACWCVWDKENTGNFADVELAWTSFNKGAKLYKWLWNGLCRKGERSVEGKSRVHPTQKPVGLLAEILKDFTTENDTILD